MTTHVQHDGTMQGVASHLLGQARQPGGFPYLLVGVLYVIKWMDVPEPMKYVVMGLIFAYAMTQLVLDAIYGRTALARQDSTPQRQSGASKPLKRPTRRRGSRRPALSGRQTPLPRRPSGSRPPQRGASRQRSRDPQ